MSQNKKNRKLESNRRVCKLSYHKTLRAILGLCEICAFHRGCNSYRNKKDLKSWKNSTKNKKQYLKNICNKKKIGNPIKRSWYKL
jgi:hypothetical protein